MIDIKHLNFLLYKKDSNIKQLAAYMGLSQQGLYQKINGRRRFYTSEAIKMVMYLEVTFEELFQKDFEKQKKDNKRGA